MPLQEKMYELFLVDKQVRGLQRRLGAATGQLDRQQAKAGQLAQQQKELLQQIKQGQAKSSSLENESRDIEQRIADLRNRMNSVTNNKEYSSLLIEVNTLKVEMGKVDETAIEQMTQVEMLETECKQLEEKLTEQQKLVDGAAGEATTCREQIGDQLEELTAQRHMAQQAVPDEVLSTFQRLAEYEDGEALAEVIEEDRRSMTYTCGGCYMSLPFELVNTLLARPDELVCCGNNCCGRILYLDQSLKTSIGAK